MRPSKNRLRKPRDFKRLYQSGRRVTAPDLTLIYRSNQQKLTRFGLAVPSRQIQTIVRRNRLKRVLRELVKRLAARGTVSLGFDIIIHGKASLLRLASLKQEEQLQQALQKANLWRSF